MITLPPLAQLDRAAGSRIWPCTGPTDMRRGFDRLADQAQQVTRQDPRAGHLKLSQNRVTLYFVRVQTIGFPGIHASLRRSSWAATGFWDSFLRKNALFVATPRGGETAAILSSLTSTCRRHEINPQVYLTQLLANLPDTPISQVDQWLPDQWKTAQAKPPAPAPK